MTFYNYEMTCYNPKKFFNPLKWIKKDGLWETIEDNSIFEKNEDDLNRERLDMCRWKVIWISYLLELKNEKNMKNRNLRYLTDLSPGKDGYVKAIIPTLEYLKSR